jgi:hypothetical protein
MRTTEGAENEITVIEKNESCKKLSSGAFVVPAFMWLSEHGIIQDWRARRN